MKCGGDDVSFPRASGLGEGKQASAWMSCRVNGWRGTYLSRARLPKWDISDLYAVTYVGLFSICTRSSMWDIFNLYAVSTWDIINLYAVTYMGHF